MPQFSIIPHARSSLTQSQALCRRCSIAAYDLFSPVLRALFLISQFQPPLSSLCFSQTSTIRSLSPARSFLACSSPLLACPQPLRGEASTRYVTSLHYTVDHGRPLSPGLSSSPSLLPSSLYPVSVPLFSRNLYHHAAIALATHESVALVARTCSAGKPCNQDGSKPSLFSLAGDEVVFECMMQALGVAA